MINTIDISGEWKFCLDKSHSLKEPIYTDTITLPDTVSNAKKCEYNSGRETGFLTDTYTFEGSIWFQRDINFDILKCENLKLFLERTRITELYVDGKNIGKLESLCTPHIYDLTEYINTGIHSIEICVSNVGYKTRGGHMTSPDTQTNWIGIVGRMELQCYGKSYLEKVFVKTNLADKTINIKANIVGKIPANISVEAESCNNEKTHHCTVKKLYSCESKNLDITYDMGENCLLWSEHNPNLYKLKTETDGDVFETVIGMRDFKTNDGKFTINGKTTFLRGKHDGMIFPLTSYAPADVDSWLRVMGISKSYGINHYRFHTCCPPEAAFAAADMLGIYLEPQLPFWGTICAPDEEGYNAEEQNFLVSEGFGILDSFGNHPSFCMMSLGNELWGSAERLNSFLGKYKKYDDRHLYTQGSNNFQWYPSEVENDDFFVGVRLDKDRLIRGSYAMCDAPLGHVQTDKPSTLCSYDEAINLPTASDNNNSAEQTVKIQYGTTMKTVKATKAEAGFSPKTPIVTHEIGQYETFPNFNEIEKYTGSLKARNLEVFRERLQEKGMLSLADSFFKCSGKLAVQCYKEELESVFRSRLLGGCQILDIQDFTGQGTALVGILDAFMDSKGLITDKQWREFCNDTVLLARFDSYTYKSSDKFTAHIELADFRNEKSDGELCWTFEDENKCALESGSCDFKLKNDSNYIDICDIDFTLPNVTEIKEYTFHIFVKGTDIENHYTISVLPEIETVDICGAYIFDEVDDTAEKMLESGKTILVVPQLDKMKNSIEGLYCTDFWCYSMFKSISDMMKKPRPVGTMGLLINNTHPALAEFKSHEYSTPIWWEIVTNSRSEILDDCSDDKRVIVRTIDNFERNHNLSLLYEYEKNGGRVVKCCCDFNKLSESFEGRCFIKSIVDYVKACNK